MCERLLTWSSAHPLLCNQEASLVPPIDGAGSQFSVVGAHLCRFLACHTCTTLPHQPRRCLSGCQDSSASSRLSAWLLERCSSLSSVLSLPESFSVYLWV